MKEMRTFLFYIALFLVGCASSPGNKKPLVIVSLPPYVEIVKELAGDKVDVISFLKEDDNPHTFEPTPKQMQQVERAALWIGVGEPFEARVTQVMKAANPDSHVLDLTTKTPTVQGDRHIWMSLRLMKSQAKAIAENLTLIVKAPPQGIKANALKLNKKLDSLDQKIFRELAPYHGEALLVSHTSFGYFCRDYNLVQVPVESEGKNPLPLQIKVILDMMQTTKFRCALTVTHGNNKGTKVIAEKMDLPVYAFNPLAQDYFDNMGHLANLIAND